MNMRCLRSAVGRIFRFSIINNNLKYYHIVKNNSNIICILVSRKSGFRRARYKIDNLYKIKSQINKVFENKQILGMISLDITKGFDSVWRHRTLQILNFFFFNLFISKILTNGNMCNVFTKRKFHITVSPCLSNIFIR